MNVDNSSGLVVLPAGSGRQQSVCRRPRLQTRGRRHRSDANRADGQCRPVHRVDVVGKPPVVPDFPQPPTELLEPRQNRLCNVDRFLKRFDHLFAILSSDHQAIGPTTMSVSAMNVTRCLMIRLLGKHFFNSRALMRRSCPPYRLPKIYFLQ